jgi:hypothetical protein
MNNHQVADDDAGEFSALDSLDLIAAYLHAKHGEEALRGAFALCDCDREELEQAADVLDAKGLSHVADIMFDIASQCRSGIEANPYPPDSFNGRYWRANWIRKHPEREERLRRRKPRGRRSPSVNGARL